MPETAGNPSRPPPQDWYALEGLAIDQITDVDSIAFLSDDQLAGGVVVPLAASWTQPVLRVVVTSLSVIFIFAGIMMGMGVLIGLGVFYFLLLGLGYLQRSADVVRLDSAGIWVHRRRTVVFLPWCMVHPSKPMTAPSKAIRIPMHPDLDKALPVALISLNSTDSLFPVLLNKSLVQINGSCRQARILVALYARMRDYWRSGEPADWQQPHPMSLPEPAASISGTVHTGRLPLSALRAQVGIVHALLAWALFRIRRRRVSVRCLLPRQRLDAADLPEGFSFPMQSLLPAAFGPAIPYRSQITDGFDVVVYEQQHPQAPVCRSLMCIVKPIRRATVIRCTVELTSRLADGRLATSASKRGHLEVAGQVSQQIPMDDPAAALAAHLAWVDELGGGQMPTDADLDRLIRASYDAEQAAGYFTWDTLPAD